MTDDLADHPSEVDDGAAPQTCFSALVDSQSVLHVRGELDLATAPVFAGALEPLTRGGGTIVLDLSELTFMDSTGINALCNAARQVLGRGRIVVLRPSPTVRRLIELTGLVSAIDLDDGHSLPARAG